MQNLTLPQVLRLESIYYLAVVALEVPSGYMSDRFGRKPTMLMACGSLLTAYALFYLGSDFIMLALAQVGLAMGVAFNSGTDTSFHYDALVSVGREDTFGDREASIVQKSILASGVAALTGGLVGLIELRYAYALSGGMALVAFLLVCRMTEPRVHNQAILSGTPVKQLRTCVHFVRHPLLMWLFVFYVLMTVLNHIPYEFYQPYLSLLQGEKNVMTTGTSLTTGIHTGLAMLLAASFAGYSNRLSQRIGLTKFLLGVCALQTLLIMLMGLHLHYLIAGLMLFRSVPRAFMTAPMNAAIAPLVPATHRATFLSMQSLAGRLAFSGVLFGLSLMGTTTETHGWTSLSIRLMTAAGIGITGLLILAGWSRKRPLK